MTPAQMLAVVYMVVASLFEIASPEGLHVGWLEHYMQCAGDGTGAKPWYVLLCVLLLAHLAARRRR